MARSGSRAKTSPVRPAKRGMRSAHGIKRGGTVIQNLEGAPRMRGPVNKPHIRAR